MRSFTDCLAVFDTKGKVHSRYININTNKHDRQVLHWDQISRGYLKQSKRYYSYNGKYKYEGAEFSGKNQNRINVVSDVIKHKFHGRKD